MPHTPANIPAWQSLQSPHLAAHLLHAKTSPHYHHLPLEQLAKNLTPQSLPEILQKLPLTTKDQLAAAGQSAWALPPSDIREIVCTSGTLGRPLDIPLSQSDLDRLAQNEAAALALAGVRPGDFLLLAVSMDRLFVAGLAYWLGGQKLGATCIRIGAPVGAQTGLLAEALNRLAPEPSQKIFIIAVPSFLAVATENFQHKIAAVIAIGEPVRNPDLSPNLLAQHLAARFHCPILSTYASTETCTTFAESPLCTGGHLNPELAAIEILDDSNQPLPPNIPGEIVITPIGVQAFPLLRFRTGDIAALYTDPCPCGLATPRLGPILGRRQHLLKLRGTSIYPNTIIESLRSIDGIFDSLILAETDTFGSDQVTVFIHASTPHLKPQIESKLSAALRVTPEIRLTDAATLKSLRAQSPTRKPTNFLDRR